MKRELWLPLALLLIGAAFALVCAAVWLTRGRSGALIRRKLALGAMLLKLGLASSGATACGADVTCYVPAPAPDTLWLDHHGVSPGGVITMDLADGSSLSGYIENRQQTGYSFQVSDLLGSQLQRDEIRPADGAFDDGYEQIVLVLDQSLPLGDHLLALYNVPVDAWDAASDADPPALPRRQYTLRLINR